METMHGHLRRGLALSVTTENAGNGGRGRLNMGKYHMWTSYTTLFVLGPRGSVMLRLEKMDLFAALLTIHGCIIKI